MLHLRLRVFMLVPCKLADVNHSYVWGTVLCLCDFMSGGEFYVCWGRVLCLCERERGEGGGQIFMSVCSRPPEHQLLDIKGRVDDVGRPEWPM
jgi:hypothetical protein